MPTATTPVPEVTPRRAQLLDAAVTVVGHSGLRGLTHRAVDRAAGLPEGTASVSYRTRLALLSGLTERIGGHLAQEVSALAAALPAWQEDTAAMPPEVIEATTQLLESWLAEPHRVICIMELTLETVRTPSLRSAFLPWRERLIDIVQQIGSRSPTSRGDSRLHAQAVVASLEGVLTSALSQAPERRVAYLRETVALVLGGMAQSH